MSLSRDAWIFGISATAVVFLLRVLLDARRRWAAKTLLKTWDASVGPFVGGGCRVKDERVTMHAMMMANPKTNTLYLFMFEAPNDEWERAWPFGAEMVGQLLLDDEV